MNPILLGSIFSIFIQNFIGYLKFKKLINPIFLFSIIHFFHNWSFSFSKYFNDIIFWRADPTTVSYATMYDVLYINLVGSWSFFMIVIVFAKTKKFNKYYKIINKQKLLYGYYILSSIFALRFFIGLGAGLAYGENQALDSMSSFDPISRILYLRVILCVIYILTTSLSRAQFLKILIIEIFLSTAMGERKDFVIIFLSYFIPMINNLNINLIMFLRYCLYSVVGTSFLLFIPIYRSINYTNGFYNQLKEAGFLINEYGNQIIFYALNLVNSEGVQNWTYQLIENGEMGLLYGKSYLQAIINMIILRPFQGDNIASWQGAYHFKNIAYPQVTNQGWDFTFTAEAIQNFGPNFAFISFIILGIFVSYFYRNRNLSDFYSILYYFTWPILAVTFRTDSTAMLRIFSYIIFVCIILYYTGNIKKLIRE